MTLRASWMIRWAVAGLLLTAAAVLAPHAFAQSASPSTTAPPPTDAASDDQRRQPPKAALDHYLLGRRWYLAGRYRDALVELKLALELDRGSPDLLYNVARVYENLSEFDQAIEYYQRYLEHLPPDANDERDRTEKTIRRLQGAKRVSAPAKAAVKTPLPPPPGVGRADVAFWLTGGAALALFAGGGVTGYLAVKKEKDVEKFVVGRDGPLTQRSKLADQTQRFALISDGLFIAGGVALTTAALLFLLRSPAVPDREQRAERALDLQLDSQRALLTWREKF
jgi:tetratricopeptide (TPR) repeat protein